MIRAHLFALDPTDAQVEAFASHCGARRVAYNWALRRVLANWDQRRAEESYGIPEQARTPWVDTSAYGLRKAWNAAKDEVAPWWRENSKEAYASGCTDLASAMKNRNSKRAKMPRFKSRHRSRANCRFATGRFGLGADTRHMVIPRIGSVRTHESTRDVTAAVAAGARVVSTTLSFQRGRWHLSLSVDHPGEAPVRERTTVVGVDLGIKGLATLSTGEVVANPRHLSGAQRELRRRQRAMAPART